MPERRKRTRLMNQINVVPYIDVMLVLLVIFMVTAPLINTSMIDLPSVSRSVQPPVAPLEVVITRKKELFLRDRERGGLLVPVSREGLLKEVKARQGRNKDQPVVISADQDVVYKEVLEVMDLLQSNGVAKVGLLAKPRAG
jgi:biopolymer transport protein TolR